MTRNLTLKLDAALLRRLRQAAGGEDKSVSQWVTDLIVQALARDAGYAQAKRRALERLVSGWDLGGRPLSREELHDR